MMITQNELNIQVFVIHERRYLFMRKMRAECQNMSRKADC